MLQLAAGFASVCSNDEVLPHSRAGIFEPSGYGNIVPKTCTGHRRQVLCPKADCSSHFKLPSTADRVSIELHLLDMQLTNNIHNVWGTVGQQNSVCGHSETDVLRVEQQNRTVAEWCATNLAIIPRKKRIVRLFGVRKVSISFRRDLMSPENRRGFLLYFKGEEVSQRR